MTTSDHETYGATRWNSVRRLFHEARELAPEDRESFLDRHCGDDEVLRREVENMLGADEASTGFLESPVTSSIFGPLEPGRQVGPFRVVAHVGAGNMGEVYRAEREGDFRMSVALKVIHAAKVDQELVWRFRHERQILASLDHPNIARLIDGGTLEDGRPWFALELVDGERIDHYCNRLRLSVPERVKLFRKVCSAVSEAHSLAIVHRDLKPANILVSRDGEPKLLDFGIAKIAEGDPLASDAPTLPALDGGPRDDDDSGSDAMTPLYASPEQAAPSFDPDAESRPIGVRSDVYALGVVLYELLTGHPPYAKTNPWPVVLRSVVEEIPKPPSHIVGTERMRNVRHPKKLTPASVAAERNVKPKTLRRQLMGDLDAILACALEKRPEDRYASVAHLDTDLRAYLEGYPVMPRQSNTFYRVGRLLRRNLLPVVVALAALLFLVTVLGMGWYHEVQILKAQELFAYSVNAHLRQGLSDEISTQDLEDRIDRIGDEAWLANTLEQLGFSLEEQGYLRGAVEFYEESLRMRRRLYGAEHIDVAKALDNLAYVQGLLGRFEVAEKNYKEDLEIRKKIHDEHSMEISRALNNLATLYQNWGGEHLAKARPLLEQALEIRERDVAHLEAQGEATDDARMQTMATRHNLATQLVMEGRFEEALDQARTVLETLEALPNPPGLKMASVLRNIALAQLGLGQSAAAETTAREVLKIYRRNYQHWKIADTESILGASLAQQGKMDDARFFLEQSVESLKNSQQNNSRHAREAEQRRKAWLEG